jgi:hypothetical protein
LCTVCESKCEPMENENFNVWSILQFENCDSNLLRTKGSIRLRDAYDVTRGWPSNRYAYRSTLFSF